MIDVAEGAVGLLHHSKQQCHLTLHWLRNGTDVKKLTQHTCGQLQITQHTCVCQYQLVCEA